VPPRSPAAASCRSTAGLGSASARRGTRVQACAHAHAPTCNQPSGRGDALVPFRRGSSSARFWLPLWPSEASPSCRPCSQRPGAGSPRAAAYMVPDLSAELPGKSFSVGVTAGLPTPELLLLLERCCTTGRTGRIGGGRSWAPASRADRAGLKVVIISVVELLLRRMAASGSRIRMVCRGLAGSELAAPIGGFFMGSSVSRTTSGACLAVFCLSSSRSSFSAVLMVFSMSCQRQRQRDVSTVPQHRPALLPPTRGAAPALARVWVLGVSDLSWGLEANQELSEQA